MLVTVTNLAPTSGVYIMPAWVGFHDGTFDTYNLGSVASTGIERAAEDGNNSVLISDFAASGHGTADGTVGAGPGAPGSVKTATFTLDGTNPLGFLAALGMAGQRAVGEPPPARLVSDVDHPARRADPHPPEPHAPHHHGARLSRC